MKEFASGLALGLLWAVVVAWAQAPAAPTAVPDWVVKYAAGQEAARRTCDVSLAQEQDKTDRLTRDLADAKAALAKAAPKAEEKK